MPRPPKRAFDLVEQVGLTLPGVEASTRYDGARVLKVHGVFLAGVATHPSAEPDTLVIRAEPDERDAFIQDAPGTYYLTDAYRRYPVVLVRLTQVDRDTLRALLSISLRLSLQKTRPTTRRSTAARRHTPGGAPTRSRPPSRRRS